MSATTIPPEDQKDIEELRKRIVGFYSGREDEERFKLYRLTRGVYGQRQLGVQMFRTKIPYGKITTAQLKALADISEHFTNGNLHLTTRQNVQLHFVKLSDSPLIWEALAKAGLTAREACGNTVRNITASPTAGIDPEEPFDVAPYVQATFEYFLRNPICQEMGRKIKPAFSSSERDSAYTYFHDFGFIPRLREHEGELRRGFKVVIGGGLGAVGAIAPTVYEFLPDDQIIPFMEACIRVFDRYGEREKRMKARMKFLIKKMGVEAFVKLAEEEWQSLPHPSVPVHAQTDVTVVPEAPQNRAHIEDEAHYQRWLVLNTFRQKQEGFYGVWLKIPRGDIHARVARPLADLIREYAADDIRITVQQGLLLRFVRPEALPHLYNGLKALNLADIGADTIADITSCPGTDTCALGVTNSTGLASTLEQVLLEEYDDLLETSDIRIKISGCMNSCGQHMAAQIGFHGSSIKTGAQVLPAMQVVLGGGVAPNGEGFIAQKVIKLPTKRIPAALRLLLDDFKEYSAPGQRFNQYFQAQGKRYFYNLLKPLAAVDNLTTEDYFDWGQDEAYRQSIGVGECAGVTLDVIGTILGEAQLKLQLTGDALAAEAYADGIYHAYTSMVIGAKALLLAKDISCNTHRNILKDFQAHYITSNEFPSLTDDFEAYVLEMKAAAPTADFAKAYFKKAQSFSKRVIAVREAQLQEAGQDKLVVDNYYKA
ncbi:MAG: nitrite reductase [Phaeodactylibacter sp.]|uniref:nitrite reductase n=1 Tax=Phaeodactylibacter sp. TaxID=1940289 RepID=UPI0032ED3415